MVFVFPYLCPNVPSCVKENEVKSFGANGTKGGKRFG